MWFLFMMSSSSHRGTPFLYKFYINLYILQPYDVHTIILGGAGGVHSEKNNIHILITFVQEADTWVKPYIINSQEQYISAVRNIGVNPPYCVLSELWVSTSYLFQDTFSTTFLGG